MKKNILSENLCRFLKKFQYKMADYRPKIRPKSAKSALDVKLGQDGLVSQEVLIAKYLEEFCVNKGGKKKRSEPLLPNKLSITKSPYLAPQVADSGSQLNLNRTSSSFGKRKPRPPKKKRPVSAPTYRLGTGSWSSFSDLNASGSTNSAVSLWSLNTSASSSSKPIYKRHHHILCVQAHPNGVKTKGVRVTSNDLNQLLAECTSKLGLQSAARKMFLSDGTEVVDVRQLVKDCDVYISMGEPFRDPIANLQEREQLRKASFWTMNGVIVPSPELKKSKKLKASLSSRMLELVDSQKRRILVFKNGEASEGVEIVANRFDEFLDDCTCKLGLTSKARCLYDWEGRVVDSFAKVPQLHQVLQPSTGIVLGPLWVTRGELFSPNGAYKFLKTMLNDTKEKISQQEIFIGELEKGLDVDGVMILNPELEFAVKQETTFLNDTKAAFAVLTESFKNIKKAYSQEESMTPAAYRLTHISEIDSNSRLLGMSGIKVELFANGSEKIEEGMRMFLNMSFLLKGIKSKAQGMERFFNMLNVNDNVKSLFGFQISSIFVKRAFLADGTEVLDLSKLEQGDKVWLSLGEPFVSVESHIVTLNIEKVKIVNLWGYKEIIQRDMWMGCDHNQTKSKQWTVVNSIPSSCETQEMKVDMTNDEKVLYLNQCSESRVPENSTFLQSRQNHCLILYPEVTLYTKGLQHENDVWGDGVQKWIITQDGFIQNKHFKNLVLSETNQRIQMLFDDNGEEDLMDGAVVSLQLKPAASGSRWVFTKSGHIQSEENPGYVLTAVTDFTISTKIITHNSEEENEENNLEPKSSQLYNFTDTQRNGVLIVEYQDPSDGEIDNTVEDAEDVDVEASMEPLETIVKEEERKEDPDPFVNVEEKFGGQNISLVLLPRFPAEHPLSSKQRWAVKTDTIPIHYTLTSTWLNQKLTWPTDIGENMLQESIEGHLCFNAPRLKWRKNYGSKSETFKVARTEQPITLRVLMNGDSDSNRAVQVVAPRVRNLKSVTVNVDLNGQLKRSSPSEVEFQQFLQKCTDVLNLTFAARRLFNSTGKEKFRLEDFEKNDLVYVSCGDNWSDPNVSQAEQQKRLLLANLASDVAKMNHYIYLKDQTGFVVRTDTNPQPGSKLYLVLEPRTLEHSKLNEEAMVNDLEKNGENVEVEDVVEDAHMTAHQRSHAKFAGNQKEDEEDDIDEENDTDESDTVTHRDVLLGIQKRQRKQTSPFLWVYHGEFIALKSNPNLVLGISQSESDSHNEVIIRKKQLENPNQRWIVQIDGTFALKANIDLVLTVSTPAVRHPEYLDELDEEHSIYFYSKLIASSKKNLMNGNSHQVFWLDTETSFLHAFATDEINKELTAANKASVCTFSIFGTSAVYQPGYLWKRMEPDGRTSSLTLCSSCGKAVRGQIKLRTISGLHEFSCVMGQAKKYQIKTPGSFLCVTSKVNLSNRECHATVDFWKRQLKRLREESSVRAIASEIHFLQSNPAVRLLVHKNGRSEQKEGDLVIGNSIPQILDMCTIKLNLPKAARRLYTMDGELITHMKQLLVPYYPELTYLKEGRHQEKVKNDENSEIDIPQDIEIEKLDVRIPIDVWVSMGEPFVPLDEVERTAILTRFEQSEKLETSNSLQIEKHRLRQIKGRRMARLSDSGEIKPVVKKAWREPTENEDDVEKSIHSLKTQLHIVKKQQELRARDLKIKRSLSENDGSSKTINFEGSNFEGKESRSQKQHEKKTKTKIYEMPRAIKLFVFPNGETSDKGDIVYAKTLHELLNNATYKLGLTSCARRVFTAEGKEIFSMNELQRNQAVCVSCGEKFVGYKERRYERELRASWSRVNRKLNEMDLNNNLQKSSKNSRSSSRPSSVVYPNTSNQLIPSTPPSSYVPHPILKRRPKSATVGWNL